MTDLAVRAATRGDRAGWEKLFLACGDFYRAALKTRWNMYEKTVGAGSRGE